MEKKKVLGLFGAIALTAAIAVSGTLAYLSFTSEEKTNKFTSDSKVGGQITETDWGYGEEGWNNYLPGDSTGKNPQVEISKDSVDAYIAMKVVIEDNDGNEISLADFTRDYATLSYKDENNKDVNGINPAYDVYGNNLYIYNDIVRKGTSSPELFNKVTVNMGILKVYKAATATETITVKTFDELGNVTETTTSTGQVLVNNSQKVYITDKDGNEVEVSNDTKLPSFNIKVTGYAVQAAGTQDTYKEMLASLAK